MRQMTSMRLRRIAAIAGIVVIPLVLVTTAIAMLYLPANLPGTADLTEVRARVVPDLKAEFAEAGLMHGAPIHIRAFMQTSEFELWVGDGDRFSLFKTYPICSYSGELGPKRQEGDLQSPEGFTVS